MQKRKASFELNKDNAQNYLNGQCKTQDQQNEIEQQNEIQPRQIFKVQGTNSNPITQVISQQINQNLKDPEVQHNNQDSQNGKLCNSAVKNIEKEQKVNGEQKNCKESYKQVSQDKNDKKISNGILNPPPFLLNILNNAKQQQSQEQQNQEQKPKQVDFKAIIKNQNQFSNQQVKLRKLQHLKWKIRRVKFNYHNKSQILKNLEKIQFIRLKMCGQKHKINVKSVQVNQKSQYIKKRIYLLQYLGNTLFKAFIFQKTFMRICKQRKICADEDNLQDYNEIEIGLAIPSINKKQSLTQETVNILLKKDCITQLSKSVKNVKNMVFNSVNGE